MTDSSRQLRRRLFDRLTQAESALDLLNVQRDVASAVIEAEAQKSRARSKRGRIEASTDIRMYRSYCDAITWDLLHPHTIRQLAERPGSPPSLIGLGPALDRAIAIADAPAANGIPTIVADLTNILRVSDVIVVRHPELPELIELKGDKVIAPLSLIRPDSDTSGFEIIEGDRILKGRIGRQLSVMRDVQRYLAKGSGKMFGLDGMKIAVESPIEAEYHWSELEEVVFETLNSGQSARRVAEGHWIAADSHRVPQQDELISDIKKFGDVMVACHFRALDEAWPDIPTPFNWPIADQARFALMEGDVQIVTVFDLASLKGLGHDGATIEEVGIDGKRVGSFATRLSYHGEDYTVSDRFLMETLYGFRTKESMVRGMCDFVIRSHDIHAS
jgi:hypothetical protein